MRAVVCGWAVMAILMGVLGCGDEENGGAPCDGVSCSGQGSCVEEDGQAACQCNEGYRPEGLTCVEDVCNGVLWVPNDDAADAPVSDGALWLSASGEELPTISTSITGNFDVSFLVEELSANGQVRFSASAGNKSIVAAMEPELAIAGWVNQISEDESTSDFINGGGTGNAGQLRIQRSGNDLTATATVGTGEAYHTYNIQLTTVSISLSLQSEDGNPASGKVTEFQVVSGSIDDDTFDCDLLQRE